jgi:hypothetical protein
MPTSKSALVAAAAAILSFAAPAALGAQKVRLTGSIVDESGGPVANVELTLRRGNRVEGVTHSGDGGQFDFGGVPPGKLLIITQRLGYQRRSFEVNVDPKLASQTVRVDILRVPTNLDSVVV